MELFSIGKNRYQKGDLYITQILEEEMKADDSRFDKHLVANNTLLPEADLKRFSQLFERDNK